MVLKYTLFMGAATINTPISNDKWYFRNIGLKKVVWIASTPKVQRQTIQTVKTFHTNMNKSSILYEILCVLYFDNIDSIIIQTQNKLNLFDL